MIFKDPWLLLLVPVVAIAFFAVERWYRPARLLFPAESLWTGLKKTWKTDLAGLPRILRLLALILVVIALAGPRHLLEESQYVSEGIDIILTIDASRSLASEDFMLMGKRYNRLAVIKGVVEDFINARTNDRIGMVAFSGLAYTVSPLTKDYAWLKENLRRIDFDIIEDGTAIGSALTASVNRLKKSEAKSKIIILLTDGVNNAGSIAPLAAAQAAKAMGIRVYTIGAGTKGLVPYPVKDFMGNIHYQQIKTDVDEQSLQEIARITGGKYFRATDTASLKQIYKEIDKMEKTPTEEKGYRDYQELFPLFLGVGIAFLFLEMILSQTVLLRIP